MSSTVYSSRLNRHLPAVQVLHLRPRDRVLFGGHPHEVVSLTPLSRTADIEAVDLGSGERRRYRMALTHRVGRWPEDEIIVPRVLQEIRDRAVAEAEAEIDAAFEADCSGAEMGQALESDVSATGGA